MGYQQELAFYLRLRGLSEGRVAEILSDIQAHPATSDTALSEEFGTPVEYAEQFGAAPKPRRTPGKVVVAVGTALAVAYALVAYILLPLLGQDVRDTVGPIRMWPALAIVVLSLAVGFAVDRARPVPRRPGPGG